MFSIPLLVLSFGILNIHAQECENVKMKMSLTKSGRVVELDVDQLCRCAGYSKSTDSPDLSKWKKKPTTDAVIVTVKPTKDKRSTFKDIDEVTDVLRENITDIATERSFTDIDTDRVIEKRVVIDKSPITMTTEETKDKATEKRDEITYKIYMTTDSADKVTARTIVDEDKNSTLVIEKSVAIKDSVKKSTGKVTKEILTAITTVKDLDIDDKFDVITDESPSDWMTESSIDMITVKTVVDKFTVKNSSDMVTDKGFIESDRSLTTKPVTDLIKENTTVDMVIHKSSSEKDIVIIPIALTTEKATPITTAKTNTTTDTSAIDITTESTKDMITEKDVVDKSYIDKVIDNSTSLMAEKVTDVPSKIEKSVVVNTTDEKSTDKSFISFTTEKDADMTKEKNTMGNATEKISTHEAIIKISIDPTTERATEKNLTDKSLDKAITNKTIVKSFIDLITERSIDKVTGKNVTEKVVDKSKKERVIDTTFTAETRERVNVTDKPYHTNGTAPTTEKKMEKSTEAALGTSHMTKKSGNRLQILLILLAIVVLAGFIFAVCYTVYMSRRSNSYVLPSPEHEATPLNNI